MMYVTRSDDKDAFDFTDVDEQEITHVNHQQDLLYQAFVNHGKRLASVEAAASEHAAQLAFMNRKIQKLYEIITQLKDELATLYEHKIEKPI